MALALPARHVLPTQCSRFDLLVLLPVLRALGWAAG